MRIDRFKVKLIRIDNPTQWTQVQRERVRVRAANGDNATPGGEQVCGDADGNGIFVHNFAAEGGGLTYALAGAGGGAGGLPGA